MNDAALKGKLALVTGASSGLGVDFARELARRGCHLVLVARREDRLQAVQQEIVDRYGVEVAVLPEDLATPEAAQLIYNRLQEQGKAVDVLVNNAGFGLFGPAWEIPWEQERQMLQVNILALAQLTHLFLPDMLARNSGFILLVASYGAFVPTPTYASYSATKSYVLSLGEALNYELRNTNVGVSVISPGVVATEFHQVAGQRLNLYQRLTTTQGADVARAGIEGMLKRQPNVIPDWLTKLTVWSTRIMPRRAMVALAHRSMNL